MMTGECHGRDTVTMTNVTTETARALAIGPAGPFGPGGRAALSRSRAEGGGPRRRW